MTTVSRSYRSSPAPRDIDVRCSSRLSGRDSREARCQLFAGHDGPHAIMFARSGERAVLEWANGGTPRDVDTVEARGRPWMRGYPMPAWTEGARAESIG